MGRSSVSWNIISIGGNGKIVLITVCTLSVAFGAHWLELSVALYKTNLRRSGSEVYKCTFPFGVEQLLFVSKRVCDGFSL